MDLSEDEKLHKCVIANKPYVYSKRFRKYENDCRKIGW